MTSVRLRPDQIARLRASGMGAAVIRHALMRWRRGDFVIKTAPPPRDKQIVLRVYPLQKKPKDVQDWQLREILDSHFAIKDAVLQARLRRERAAAEREVEEQLALARARGAAGYIIETDTDTDE